MNSSACPHPLLSRALQFPQYGIRQKTVKLPPLPAESAPLEIKAKLGFKALELLFHGLLILTKPLMMLGGKAFADQRVDIDW